MLEGLKAHWSRSLSLTFFFFFLTLAVYYLTSPGPTPYNSPVHLGAALLEGRLDVPNGDVLATYMDFAVYKGKYYIVEPPMTSIVMLPGILLFGTALNQTAVSIIIGGITASSVYQLTRRLTEKLSVQVWLTLLFVFGTIYWYHTVDGAVTDIAHALATLFLVLAIYATLVSKQPFIAGLLLGAAYWTRPPTVLALAFFIIMFADQWLPKSNDKSLLKRIDLRPLAQLGFGLGIFVVLSFAYNYLRFDTIEPVSYSIYIEHYREVLGPSAPDWSKGVFNTAYIHGHIRELLQPTPVFLSQPAYVVPAYAGLAIWVTTPAFLYTLFAGIRSKLVIVLGSAALLVTLTIFILSSRGLPHRLDLDFPLGLDFYPFGFLIVFSLLAGIRNKLIIACWLAIIPIALIQFLYGHTPFQFGYRFSLDYYPFLFLLTAIVIGDKIKWHHMFLITLSIMVNLWGVMWLHNFRLDDFLGWQWLAFG